MKKQYNIAWFAIVLIVAFLVTRYSLDLIVTHPGRMLQELGGDAIKNFFTYSYYALNDSDLWFTGMNYPYGEHLVYTDGLPMLAVPLSWLRAIIPLSLSDVAAVLNLSLVLGFILAIVYTYKLLVSFKVNRILALVFASLIVVMAPQVTRIFAHFGLGYLCVFPMTFYWLLQYYRSSKKKYVFYLIILYLIIPFAHPYYIAIVIVWVLLYAIGYLLFKRENFSGRFKHLVLLLLVPILSALAFKTTMLLTDPVKDRPTTPYGTFSALTDKHNIFTSDVSPIWVYLHRQHKIVGIGYPREEGAAYIGVVPILVILFVLSAGILYALLRLRKKGLSPPQYFEPIWLFIGIMSLLAAMGIPFIWNMEWLVDHLSAFKQFRSLGRFGLIYYYTCATLAAVALYHISKRLAQKTKVLGIVVIAIALSIWGYEAFHFAKYYRELANPGVYNYDSYTFLNRRDWNDVFNDQKLKTSDFQSMMIIPFSSIGSEKLWLFANDWGGFCLVTPIVNQLKIPMMSSNMSRSSWGQTFKQIKTFSGPFSTKPVLDDIKSDKDILLLVFHDDNKEHGYTPTPDEKFLYQQADSLGFHLSYYVYRLNPKKIRQKVDSSMRYVASIADSLPVGNTSFLNSNSYYYQHFDNGKAESHLFGSGADTPVFNKTQTMLEVDVHSWNKAEEYEMSVWALVNDSDYKVPMYFLNFFNAQGEKVLTNELYASRSTFDHNGMWFRTSTYFYIPDDVEKISFDIRECAEGTYYALDELLIRQAADTIISKDKKGRVMVNNHLQPLDM